MRALNYTGLVESSGGVPHGPAFSGEISAVTTDSRAVTPGCLFAAIPGERFDGHDFIPQAFAQGAACVLAQRVPAGTAGCVIQVPETVPALQRIAAYYRQQFDLPLLGISGSVGKTTAKEMTAAVLARRYTVHKTEGNHNNDLGVPLTLLGLRPEHSAAVVELGVSRPGDMARIAGAARPTMALYTAIGDSHLVDLGSREGVLKEKTVMNQFLPEGGRVFYNGDDPLLSAALGRRENSVSFGLGADCAVRATDVEFLPEGGTRCRMNSGAASFAVEIPAYGEHMVYAALAGAAVGLSLGLTPEEIAAGIGDYAPVGHRARLLRTPCLRVIDDCYNANPTSTASALRSLARWEGRRVAILGDMLDMGERSVALHREIGSLAAALGVDLVLTAGDLAGDIAAAAGPAARHFPQRDALISALPGLLRPGDTVLVKASRALRFEEVTAALEALRL